MGRRRPPGHTGRRPVARGRPSTDGRRRRGGTHPAQRGVPRLGDARHRRPRLVGAGGPQRSAAGPRPRNQRRLRGRAVACGRVVAAGGGAPAGGAAVCGVADLLPARAGPVGLGARAPGGGVGTGAGVAAGRGRGTGVLDRRARPLAGRGRRPAVQPGGLGAPARGVHAGRLRHLLPQRLLAAQGGQHRVVAARPRAVQDVPRLHQHLDRERRIERRFDRAARLVERQPTSGSPDTAAAGPTTRSGTPGPCRRSSTDRSPGSPWKRTP